MKVYGLYPGFPDFGIDDSCHPEDLAQIKNFSPHGKVFQSDLEEVLDYIQIVHGLECFRVRRNQFQQLKLRSLNDQTRMNSPQPI
jgi:hypothetical protein